MQEAIPCSVVIISLHLSLEMFLFHVLYIAMEIGMSILMDASIAVQ